MSLHDDIKRIAQEIHETEACSRLRRETVHVVVTAVMAKVIEDLDLYRAIGHAILADLDRQLRLLDVECATEALVGPP